MAPHEIELIEKARSGDTGAFEALVYQYDKQVLTIAARYVNSSDDAKDIYQEVFLRVYKGLKKFQLRSEFSTWIFRIATNVCLSYHSRRKRRAHVSLDQEQEVSDGEASHGVEIVSEEHSPHQQTVNAELSARVEEAMDALSPQQKIIFTLKHYQGYKLNEIALMLKCSEGTVKKQLFTAVRRLREALKEFA
ncbi:MAG: RNA polymerase sigma factor [Bacteroidota bacterium]|nr:RNA polymerase sigma factor [Bacteroidota bacterium]